MTTYTFDYGVAGTACDDMAAVTKSVQDSLAQMEQQVVATLADWEDSAKEAYATAKAQWDAAAQRMPVHLAAAQQALGQISDGYFQVEKTGAQAWSGYSVK